MVELNKIEGKTENVGQSRLFFFCRHTITTRLSASLIQINISKRRRDAGETESGRGSSLGAASCLMFGYKNRDESHTSNIWDEGAEAAERGWGRMEEGKLSFPKGPERLDVRHVWLRAIKLIAGMLLNICARRPPHPGRKRITGSSISDTTHTVFLFHQSQTTFRLRYPPLLYTFGRFMTLCSLRPKQSDIQGWFGQNQNDTLCSNRAPEIRANLNTHTHTPNQTCP